MRFCGVRVLVEPGVFVPRPQTEALARRAVGAAAVDGIAVDLCTGSGAVAVVLRAERPGATVIATDVDPLAVACARRNGVEALPGDLDEPLPPAFRERVDVVTAVVPYVPTEALHLLPRDVLAYEPLARWTADRAGRRSSNRPRAPPRACSGRAGRCCWSSAGTKRTAVRDHCRRRPHGDPGASG